MDRVREKNLSLWIESEKKTCHHGYEYHMYLELNQEAVSPAISSPFPFFPFLIRGCLMVPLSFTWVPFGGMQNFFYKQSGPPVHLLFV